MDIVDHLRLVVAPHAQRFIDGHFGNNAPRPQISIPASENEDSDLILSRGIKSAADEIERLRGALATVQAAFKNGDGGHDYFIHDDGTIMEMIAEVIP